MPNIVRSLALSFLIAFLGVQTATAQKKPKIKGNRIVAPYKAPLEAFHKIVLSEDLKVHIVAADSTYVAILADDNLPPVFKFEVKDSTLHLQTYYTITAAKQLDITIFTPHLSALQLQAGEAAVTLDPRFSSVSLTAIEDTQMAVTGQVAQLQMTLSGKAFASVNALTDQMSIEMSDRATATLSTEVRNNATLSLQDKAGVQWNGSAAHLAASLQGNTQLSASELLLKEAMVNAAGDAKIDLYVADHLSYFAKENSQLDLFGLPRVDLLEFSGRAQLRKKELK